MWSWDMNRQELQRYISEVYSTVPEFPWIRYPNYAVFRRGNNQKWFALVMDIPKSKLGLPSADMIDVVNLKCDPILIGSLRGDAGIFPAYHMSKANWITVALDGSVPDEKLKMLLDLSYELTATKMKMKTKQQNPI